MPSLLLSTASEAVTIVRIKRMWLLVKPWRFKSGGSMRKEYLGATGGSNEIKSSIKSGGKLVLC